LSNNGEAVDVDVDAASGASEEIGQLNQDSRSISQENIQLKQRVNELTALTYQVVNHFENEFFNNQTMLRAIRDRLVMTPEIWAIVNKSKEQQQEPNS
jgi:hypothetical protein